MGVTNFTWFFIKYKSMGVTKFIRFYKQNLGLSKLFPKKRKQRRVSQTLGLPFLDWTQKVDLPGFSILFVSARV